MSSTSTLLDEGFDERLPLTRAQRRERTARALAAGGRTRSRVRRQQLIDYVIRINMEVSRSVASRYFNRGIEEDDLVQVANAALTRAAHAYDASRHEDFLSYAVPTMRGELKKHFRDKGWSVRPPRRIQDLQARVVRAESDLHQELGAAPTYAAIADHLDEDLGDVREAMSADGCFAPTSLDRPLPGADERGGATLADLYGNEDSDSEAAEARVVLAPVVRALKERDRRILYLRFFEQRTQQEIADEIGVTQMQVSRLITRILRDLRQALGELPGTSSTAA